MKYELTDEVACPECDAAAGDPCVRYGTVNAGAGWQVVVERDEHGPVLLLAGDGRPLVHGYRQRVIVEAQEQP